MFFARFFAISINKMSNDLTFSVKTPDFEMEYARFGNGPKTLVIIPGLSIKSVVRSASAIRSAYSVFESEYTIYLFDRKMQFGNVYTLAEMADDTVAAMRALGINKATIYGTSQGGMVGQYIAINYPEVVENLILASSSSKALPLQLQVIGHWTDLCVEGKAMEFVEDFIDNAFTPRYLERYKPVLLKMYRSVTPDELHRFAVTSAACAHVNTYNDLGKIKCPVFVIGAALDHVVGAEASTIMYEKLKAEGVSCQFYMYNDYGHAAFDEAKDYRQRIYDFLQTV